MSGNSKSGSSGGVGLGGVLTIVFVVLKLVGVIDWSWWWVLSPLLIGIALSLFLVLLVTVLAVAGAVIAALTE